MQRFRVMYVYASFVIAAIVVLAASIAWLRRPADGIAQAEPPTRVSLAVGTQPTTLPSPAGHEVAVAIDNFNFKPKELTVTPGTTVTWTNHDDVPHTATTSAGPATFDSKTLDSDDRYSFTFTQPGTYQYYCKVHPHMKATVVVK